MGILKTDHLKLNNIFLIESQFYQISFESSMQYPSIYSLSCPLFLISGLRFNYFNLNYGNKSIEKFNGNKCFNDNSNKQINK